MILIVKLVNIQVVYILKNKEKYQQKTRAKIGIKNQYSILPVALGLPFRLSRVGGNYYNNALLINET